MDETAWTEPEGDAKPEPRTHHADGAAPTVQTLTYSSCDWLYFATLCVERYPCFLCMKY